MRVATPKPRCVFDWGVSSLANLRKPRRWIGACAPRWGPRWPVILPKLDEGGKGACFIASRSRGSGSPAIVGVAAPESPCAVARNDVFSLQPTFTTPVHVHAHVNQLYNAGAAPPSFAMQGGVSSLANSRRLRRWIGACDPLWGPRWPAILPKFDGGGKDVWFSSHPEAGGVVARRMVRSDRTDGRPCPSYGHRSAHTPQHLTACPLL